jgi:hypothetical protein
MEIYQYHTINNYPGIRMLLSASTENMASIQSNVSTTDTHHETTPLNDTPQSNADVLDPFHQSDIDDRFNIGKCCKLSYDLRLTFCKTFIFAGIILFGFSVLLCFRAKPYVSVMPYFTGNILLFVATLCLFGPMKQIKIILKNLRPGMAILIYFITFSVILYIFFTFYDPFSYIILLPIQCFAYMDYIIVLIPGARNPCLDPCCNCNNATITV